MSLKLIHARGRPLKRHRWIYKSRRTMFTTLCSWRYARLVVRDVRPVGLGRWQRSWLLVVRSYGWHIRPGPGRQGRSASFPFHILFLAGWKFTCIDPFFRLIEWMLECHNTHSLIWFMKCIILLLIFKMSIKRSINHLILFYSLVYEWN